MKIEIENAAGKVLLIHIKHIRKWHFWRKLFEVIIKFDRDPAHVIHMTSNETIIIKGKIKEPRAVNMLRVKSGGI